MSIRDQILAIPDDLKSERVTVPEWKTPDAPDGVTFVVRELTVRDRNAYIQSLHERVAVDGGFDMVPKSDPDAEARLVVATTFDEDGNRVFEDGDVAALGAKSPGAVDRLAAAARKLSGLEDSADDPAKEAANFSSPTESDSSSSS